MELNPIEEMIAQIPIIWRLIAALWVSLPLMLGVWLTRNDI